MFVSSPPPSKSLSRLVVFSPCMLAFAARPSAGTGAQCGPGTAFVICLKTTLPLDQIPTDSPSLAGESYSLEFTAVDPLTARVAGFTIGRVQNE